MPPEAGVIEQPIQTTPPAPGDWRTHMTDEHRADPVVSGWAEKASEKTIGDVVKGYAHLSKRMGSAINLPGKDKPEEVAAFKTKLYEAGVLTAPPATPKDYGIIKPEQLPDGLQWSDELSGKFATALHKHGVPKEALDDLMPLYLEAISGVTKAVSIDREQSMAALRTEHGEKFAEREEMVKRMLPGLFSPESLELFDQTGLGNDPKLLSALMRLAPLAMQDTSFVDSIPRTGGEISGEKAKEEYAKIISDAAHPMHEGYMRKDPKVEQYIDDLYRQAYGNQKVVR